PIEGAVASLAFTIGVDESYLMNHPLDGPMPDLPVTNGPKSRQKLLLDKAKREKLTIRQLAQHVAGGHGHWTLCGTPAQIADELEAWFKSKACDGFNVLPAWLPGCLDDFVDHVVPELQGRGLFRTEYEGETLRDNLGLKRPPHFSRR